MFGLTSEARLLRRWSLGARSGAHAHPRRIEAFNSGGIEPTVEDLLDDPVTGAIMAYDHVSPMAVRALMAQMRARLRQRAD